MTRHFGVLLFAAVIGAPVSAYGATAEFPARPLRLVSPFSPGGGNDFVSRTMAQAMAKELGQTVVVDNRPGANTIIGMDIVAKSVPDGYTLITTSSTQAINATLYPKLPYDSIKSFQPISMVGTSPLIIAVPVSSPITSIPGIGRRGESETGRARVSVGRHRERDAPRRRAFRGDGGDQAAARSL